MEEQNDKKVMDEKTKKSVSIIIIVIMSIFIALIFTLISDGDDDTTDEVAKEYFFGNTLSYEDIDITVTGIEFEKDEDPSSEFYGKNEFKIYFTYKNNRTKDFDVDPWDITIKTKDKGELYEHSGFSEYKSLAGVFSDDTMIAGEEKSYWITFYVPYSLEEKKFEMIFDWGVLSIEQKYNLYNKDGSNAAIKAPDNSAPNYSNLFAGTCPINMQVTYYTSDQTVSIRQTNNSDKTIVTIKYLIVVYNAYGEVLQSYGYGASALTATYDDFHISPGSSYTEDWRLDGFSDGKKIDVYVYSVLYSDNTEWGSHSLDVNTIKECAPKMSVTGRYA